MNWITGLQKAIDYIEANLTEELDPRQLAAVSFSSEYHFQRVFSILCGYTLGEYIRMRRLTLAGAELNVQKRKVIDVAMKYGYDSPDSFCRAFQKFHGISPSEARNSGAQLRSFSPLSIKLSLEGGSIMNYRMENKKAFSLVGHRTICCGSMGNAENIRAQTTRHWESTRHLQQELKQMRQGGIPVWYDLYTDFQEDTFSHIIAVEAENAPFPQPLERIAVPAHLYAVFETERCASPDEIWVDTFKRIISQWLPASDYVLSDHPQVIKQIYTAGRSDNYMEIWLPIEPKLPSCKPV